MENSKKTFDTIDAYIQSFPVDIQKRLEQIRALIHEEAPEATEKISYQMPTFYYNGNLVHFAAFKHHLGFYPTPSGIEAFAEELSKYKGAKGSVQFPYSQEIPFELIRRIVRYRLQEHMNKQKK